MVTAIADVKSYLSELRTGEQFRDIWESSNKRIVEQDLGTLTLPRKRWSPARFSGPAEAYAAPSAEDHNREAFCSFIDTVTTQLPGPRKISEA